MEKGKVVKKGKEPEKEKIREKGKEEKEKKEVEKEKIKGKEKKGKGKEEKSNCREEKRKERETQKEKEQLKGKEEKEKDSSALTKPPLEPPVRDRCLDRLSKAIVGGQARAPPALLRPRRGPDPRGREAGLL